jgi:hypothetical protein
MIGAVATLTANPKVIGEDENDIRLGGRSGTVGNRQAEGNSPRREQKE